MAQSALSFPFARRIHHLHQVQSFGFWQRCAPDVLEQCAPFIERNHAGEVVRLAAHVRGALHVVLSAQRIHAAARFAEVAGEQREIDQAHHAFRALLVLGHAEAVKAHRGFRRRVKSRGAADEVSVDAANLCHFLRRKLPNEFAKFIPVGNALVQRDSSKSLSSTIAHAIALSSGTFVPGFSAR